MVETTVAIFLVALSALTFTLVVLLLLYVSLRGRMEERARASLRDGAPTPWKGRPASGQQSSVGSGLSSRRHGSGRTQSRGARLS